MKYYYALFKQKKTHVEVEFPDLEGCVTYGKDWEEAIELATDVLAAWLAHAEPEWVVEPSKEVELRRLTGKLVPIPVDEKLLENYQEKTRVNVIFPTRLLKKIDYYRNQKGLKRSTLLAQAVEAYLQRS